MFAGMEHMMQTPSPEMPLWMEQQAGERGPNDVFGIHAAGDPSLEKSTLITNLLADKGMKPDQMMAAQNALMREDKTPEGREGSFKSEQAQRLHVKCLDMYRAK